MRQRELRGDRAAGHIPPLGAAIIALREPTVGLPARLTHASVVELMESVAIGPVHVASVAAEKTRTATGEAAPANATTFCCLPST